MGLAANPWPDVTPYLNGLNVFPSKYRTDSGTGRMLAAMALFTLPGTQNGLPFITAS